MRFEAASCVVIVIMTLVSSGLYFILCNETHPSDLSEAGRRGNSAQAVRVQSDCQPGNLYNQPQLGRGLFNLENLFYLPVLVLFWHMMDPREHVGGWSGLWTVFIQIILN